MAAPRWSRLFAAPIFIVSLACASRSDTPSVTAPDDSPLQGVLRLEVPALAGTLGGPAYATIRRCGDAACAGFTDVVTMSDTVGLASLDAGTYAVRLDAPAAYDFAGDTTGRTRRVTIRGGTSSTLRFAVQFRPLFDPSEPTGPLALVPASHVRVIVTGLDGSSNTGGRVTGGSERWSIAAQNVPASGMADVRLGWGHWMDYYYWLTYEPPAGYRVVSPAPSAREIWFSSPVARTIWPIALERVP